MSKVNKYGVPISNINDDRASLIQPKFSNRFRVFFYNLGDKDKYGSSDPEANILSGQVESIDRPTIQYNNKPVHSFLGKGFVSGRGTYGNISVVMRDDIANATMSYFMTQMDIQTSRMYPVTSAGAGAFESNMLGVSPYFSMAVEIMDGRTNHTALEVWLFDGCLIESLKPSNNSYENDLDLSTYSVDITFESVRIFQPEKKMFAGRKYDESGGDSNSNLDILEKAAADIEAAQKEAQNGFMSRLNKIKDTVEDTVENVVDDITERFDSFF